MKIIALVLIVAVCASASSFVTAYNCSNFWYHSDDSVNGCGSYGSCMYKNGQCAQQCLGADCASRKGQCIDVGSPTSCAPDVSKITDPKLCAGTSTGAFWWNGACRIRCRSSQFNWKITNRTVCEQQPHCRWGMTTADDKDSKCEPRCEIAVDIVSCETLLGEGLCSWDLLTQRCYRSCRGQSTNVSCQSAGGEWAPNWAPCFWIPTSDPATFTGGMCKRQVSTAATSNGCASASGLFVSELNLCVPMCQTYNGPTGQAAVNQCNSNPLCNTTAAGRCRTLRCDLIKDQKMCNEQTDGYCVFLERTGQCVMSCLGRGTWKNTSTFTVPECLAKLPAVLPGSDNSYTAQMCRMANGGCTGLTNCNNFTAFGGRTFCLGALDSEYAGCAWQPQTAECTLRCSRRYTEADCLAGTNVTGNLRTTDGKPISNYCEWNVSTKLCSPVCESWTDAVSCTATTKCSWVGSQCRKACGFTTVSQAECASRGCTWVNNSLWFIGCMPPTPTGLDAMPHAAAAETCRAANGYWSASDCECINMCPYAPDMSCHKGCVYSQQFQMCLFSSAAQMSDTCDSIWTGGAIAGLVIGVIVLLAIVLAAVYYFKNKAGAGATSNKYFSADPNAQATVAGGYGGASV